MEQAKVSIVDRHPLVVMGGMIFAPVELSAEQIVRLRAAFEKLFQPSPARDELMKDLLK